MTDKDELWNVEIWFKPGIAPIKRMALFTYEYGPFYCLKIAEDVWERYPLCNIVRAKETRVQGEDTEDKLPDCKTTGHHWRVAGSFSSGKECLAGYTLKCRECSETKSVYEDYAAFVKDALG